jgi:hypothetical protein
MRDDDKVNLSVRVRAELRDAVRQFGKQANLTNSGAVQLLLRRGLEMRPPKAVKIGKSREQTRKLLNDILGDLEAISDRTAENTKSHALARSALAKCYAYLRVEDHVDLRPFDTALLYPD